MAKMSEIEVDPIEVLREDLEDDDITVQLDAVRNLQTIALALGQDLARSKMLPFLHAFCFPVNKQNDFGKKDSSLGVKEEVLREIALALDGSMLQLLGGKESALNMLPLQHKLAMVEETVIREAAVAGIISCVKELDGLFVDQHVFPLITSLAEKDWWTSRVSAASCGPKLYPYLHSNKCRNECATMILKLCRDEMPMVRHETYVSIPSMLKAMADYDINGLLQFIIPVLKILAKELQENMRHQIVDLVKALLKLNKPALIDVCRKNLTMAISDANWRVRKRFLDQLMAITDCSPESFVEEILEGFVLRLRDTEPTVRVKAIQLIPEFFSHKNCNAAKVQELITEEVISSLVKEEYPEVREAISGSILHIFQKLKDANKGLKASTKEEIVDIMVQLQSDESGEVRKNFCSGLEMAYSLCGEDLFVSRLLPLVLQLQEDPKWRVRSGVLENINLLIKLLKSNKIPENTCHKMVLDALKDPVADARNKCISKISGIVPVMGSKWVQDKIFSVVVKEFYDQQNKYLYRIVPIRIAERFAVDLVDEKQTGTEELRYKSVEMMCRGCKDHISNVRLASTDSLINFLRVDTSRKYANQIRGSMELLSRDTDEDVKYLSIIALGMLKA